MAQVDFCLSSKARNGAASDAGRYALACLAIFASILCASASQVWAQNSTSAPQTPAAKAQVPAPQTQGSPPQQNPVPAAQQTQVPPTPEPMSPPPPDPSRQNQAGPPATQGTEPAQQPSPDTQTEAGQFVFKKQVEEVVLHAVVVGIQNDLVSSLQKQDFQVFEDGKPQQITSFHQEKVPVALGILIDNSGSMRPKRAAVNQAAMNLIRSSDPQDQIFVVNFGEQYYLDQDFTNDESKLQAALGRIETRGSTALYDTIVASANHMKQGAELQKRILLVVTDGDDNASQESLEEAVQQLQQKDAPVVYTIGLLNPSRPENSALRSLRTISQETGGAAYFPADVREVDAITRGIGSAIRSQYVIGYKSSSTATGHVYHRITVNAHDPSGLSLRVRTRTGYFSDSPGATK